MPRAAASSVLLATVVVAAASTVAVGALITRRPVVGPTAAVAFALVRDYNRASVVGTATGVVNVGGFVATIFTCILIGAVLDVAGNTPHGFRLALTALVGVQLLGTVQVGRWWLRARNFVLSEQSKGRAVPIRLTRHRFDLS